MKKLLLYLLLSCSTAFALPVVKATGNFEAVGSVTSPVTLYTPKTAGLFRVTVYVEDTTRMDPDFSPVYPDITFTSPNGATSVGTPFGNQNSSWAGSDTEIIDSVAGEPITFTCTVSYSSDTYKYHYVIESL